MASKSIDCYIPSDLKKEFKYINYNYKNVMIHPITDKPIFFLADMPHLVKKIVNALEMSSLKKSKRNMKYSGCPLNSKMIQDVWRLTRNNCKHRLMETKLSEKHFNKDTFSRMTVSLAVQLLSSSVVTMFKKSNKRYQHYF